MRKKLLALAVAGVFVLGACGGDDDDSADQGTEQGDEGSGQSADGGSADQAAGQTDGGEEAAAGEGYTPEIHSNFVSACVAQPQATEEYCECTWTAVTQVLSADEFIAYDQAVQADPSAAAPQELIDAARSCAPEGG
jgi:hypothetical protein